MALPPAPKQVKTRVFDPGEIIANKIPPDGVSYTRIEVLPFLRGRPLDRVTKGYLHSLRPSEVVINHTKMDAMAWRVNIWINDAGLIEKIYQEVEVALYGGVENGYHLECLLDIDLKGIGVHDTE